MDTTHKKSPAGTQSIARTIRVMKTIAERKEIGWRLTDLAARCGLGKATAYRIVACLTSERIVLQRSEDRRYIPGPLLYELALSTPAYSAFAAALHQDLQRLAEIGGNAFLYLRSGDEVVCIDRAGITKLRPVTAIGRRRPITQSTFGIAMLLAMPREQQQSLLRAQKKMYGASAVASAYLKVLARSRRYGFGLNRGDVVPRLTSVAIPLLDNQQRPFAAIGVTGGSASLRGKRLHSTVDLIRSEARRIERQHARLIGKISHA